MATFSTARMNSRFISFVTIYLPAMLAVFALSFVFFISPKTTGAALLCMPKSKTVQKAFPKCPFTDENGKEKCDRIILGRPAYWSYPDNDQTADVLKNYLDGKPRYTEFRALLSAISAFKNKITTCRQNCEFYEDGQLFARAAPATGPVKRNTPVSCTTIPKKPLCMDAEMERLRQNLLDAAENFKNTAMARFNSFSPDRLPSALDPQHQTHGAEGPAYHFKKAAGLLDAPDPNAPGNASRCNLTNNKTPITCGSLVDTDIDPQGRIPIQRYTVDPKTGDDKLLPLSEGRDISCTQEDASNLFCATIPAE